MEKNKINIIILSSAEFELTQSMVKVKSLFIHRTCIIQVSRSIDTNHQYHHKKIL